MAVPNLPPPPVKNDVSGDVYRDWFYKAYQYLKQLTALALGGTVTSVDITAGTGISSSGGPITTSGSITVTNTDLGSAQNIFKNIAVSGQNTIVANSNDDTLTLVAGTGITITTDDATDSVTINSSATGGGYPEHTLQQDITVESYQSYVVVGPLNLNGFTLTNYGRVKVT